MRKKTWQWAGTGLMMWMGGAAQAGDISQIELNLGINESEMQRVSGGRFNIESHDITFQYWENMTSWLNGGVELSFTDNTFDKGGADTAMPGQRLGIQLLAQSGRSKPIVLQLDALYRFERMEDSRSDLVVQAYYWHLLAGVDFRISQTVRLFANAGGADIDGRYDQPGTSVQRFHAADTLLFQGGIRILFNAGDSVKLAGNTQNMRGASLSFLHQYGAD